MQMTRLTTHGDVQSAALSPDGRYLAQVRMRDGRWGLWVRQIATGSEVEAVSGQENEIGDVNFSRDGNYLHFRSRDPDTPQYSALFQVPSLGGTPRKVLFDVDTAVSFSPDGRQFAFIRGYPHLAESALMVANGMDPPSASWRSRSGRAASSRTAAFRGRRCATSVFPAIARTSRG